MRRRSLPLVNSHAEGEQITEVCSLDPRKECTYVNMCVGGRGVELDVRVSDMGCGGIKTKGCTPWVFVCLSVGVCFDAA